MKARTLLLSIAALLLAVSASAQEKLFKSALQKGRNPDSFYVIENTNVKYTFGDFRTVAQKNGYLLDPTYTTQQVSRFGDVATVISVVRFLPESEYLSYIQANVARGWSGIGLSTMKQDGDAFLYYYPHWDKKKDSYFYQFHNVYWSGEWDNHLISGSGEGFAYDGMWYVAFKGSFHKGYPTGKATFRWVKRNDIKLMYTAGKEKEMASNSSKFHDDMAWFSVGDKYGFIDAAKQNIVAPTFKTIVAEFKDNVSSDANYALIKHTDGYEWKMNRAGELYAYSDAQQKIFDEEKAAAEKARQEAARIAAEERRIAEQKAAEERRKAEEERREYLAKVKANSDKSRWQQGDRLCLEFGKPGQYITGTLEEWNGDKSKCKIKIVTSPGSRVQYNGENLEKNNTMWIATSGEGWHKALPEEIEVANRDDRSTHHETHTIDTAVICPDCGGKGYKTYTTTGWFGTTNEHTEKCYRCNGVGFIQKTQTF